ncbi:class I histocompatibility antigen, F10 alpha chain-like [Pantherophis guttatus]|uniref:Class I histocompatibility antigen, F10 alpha chain-like n=1 Tax=Pantherophis guttatus TaxID=94885 RepID=A0ABM3ZFL8_PANGU|nr:class I histocompatibility antigen, F10 alpha chain-like [Pantherophis guttatus]
MGVGGRKLRFADGMALRSAPLLLLVLVLWEICCFSSSLHSLKYFYISVSDLSQGLPHFGVLGYVDSQVFVVYDSKSRKFQPRASWMEKMEKDYWDTQSQIGQVTEEVYRAALETLRNRHNQSKGLHMIQQMYGCERRGDGSKGGLYHFGYDGRTFITFDKETVTWVAPNPQAQITQRKWDALPGFSQRVKSYLEEECIGWLEKYLSYGKETLLKTGELLDPGWIFPPL